jgi:hypothetical protein
MVAAVVAIVLATSFGCGGSDSDNDDAGGSGGSETTEAADTTTTTAPIDLGPREIRLEGTREDSGRSYDELARFLLEGPCDGAGECTLSRPDGALGYGVPGWEIALELGDDGTYTYEGVETLTVDRCGDEVLTDELQSTLVLTATPADGGDPEVTVSESWAEVPQAEMSNGSMCSGLSATVFTLG